MTLEVSLKDKLTRLQFKPDGAASRSSYSATATYYLSGEEISVQGRSDADTSFSVPREPYGDVSAQTNASDRVMRVLAGRIVDDLRLQLATAD